jgi:hypothetical protein
VVYQFGDGTGLPAGIAIASGLVPGVSHINKFGRNTDIDTATTPEDVWNGGGIWVAPTAARTHQIVSTSTDDDGSPAGTGARTVTIEGLDSAGVEQSETVTMDGTTNVATANTYTMIHRMYVATGGSTGNNVGTITATADTDSTVTAQITAGFNQSSMAIYQVPSNKTGYMTAMFGLLNEGGGATGNADVRLGVQPSGGVFRIVSHHGLVNAGSTHFNHMFNPPIKLEASDIVKVQVEAVTANDTDVSAGFDIVLVEN